MAELKALDAAIKAARNNDEIYIAEMGLIALLPQLVEAVEALRKAKIGLDAANPIIAEAVRINLRAMVRIDGVAAAQGKVLEAQVVVDKALSRSPEVPR